MTPTILTYENIVCKRSLKTVVSLQHLALQKGDILGIIGPNGAGKSTLLKACALIAPPDDGLITFDGEILSATPPRSVRRQWACVFQHSTRFQASVYKNVEIGLSIHHVPKQLRHEKVMKWLHHFEIAHLANEDAHTLSGGEAQRMNLARAFVLQPSVLFLDEPFSALDFQTKMSLIYELKKVISETETTVILISHDFIDIEILTNKLIYVEDGMVKDQGETKSVLTSPSIKLAKFLTPWNHIKSFIQQ